MDARKNSHKWILRQKKVLILLMLIVPDLLIRKCIQSGFCMHVELFSTSAQIDSSHFAALLSSYLKTYPVVEKHKPYNYLTRDKAPESNWLRA